LRDLELYITTQIQQSKETYDKEIERLNQRLNMEYDKNDVLVRDIKELKDKLDENEKKKIKRY